MEGLEGLTHSPTWIIFKATLEDCDLQDLASMWAFFHGGTIVIELRVTLEKVMGNP